MPQISIIQKTDILEAGRFDAEYFKREYLEIEQKVNKTGYFLLMEVLHLWAEFASLFLFPS